MANIYFISLGCDKNRVDAEIMAERLINAGHTITDDIASADCAIVNTCGFIESAKQEAIDNIFDMVRAKENGDIKAIIVTGCLAERYREQLRQEIPECDAVLGLAANCNIVAAVERALGGECFNMFCGGPEDLIIEGKRALSTPQHYAYLKIAEGCSNHCTYCAIPGIRGRYRSRAMENIVKEAKELAARGVRELILIAQDTTSYGSDLANGENLVSLLRELIKIDALWKIRILYAYPERLTDELIDLIANEPKIAKYLDLPMQHANRSVLHRMGRGASGDENLALIEKLRCAVPNITLRSTFIVGFPGETEQEFDELMEFISKAQLDRAGCFAYSAEEGTPAARMKDQLDDETKQHRAQLFTESQTAIMLRRLDMAVGTTVEAICDGYDDSTGMFACRSDSDAPEVDSCIYVPAEQDLMPGEIYKLVITAADGDTLLADVVQD